MFPHESILVATDLSERCEPALRTASDLAAMSGAKLHVLHAFELASNPYAHRAGARTAFLALLEEARAGLTEQLKRTISPDLKVASIKTELYLPWKAILQRAEDVAADLVVLGPHERVFGDRLFGATADRVIRFGSAAALVVRRGTGLRVSRIVVAIDGSRATGPAWTEAISWAQALSASNACELHIVLSASEWIDRIAGTELLGDAMYEAAETLIDSNVTVIGEILSGEGPAADIATYADRVDADLLIMSSTGHSMLDRAIAGSVTAQVTPMVSCAVLVVPLKEARVSAPDLMRWQLPLAML